MIIKTEKTEERMEVQLQARIEAQEKKIDGLTQEIHKFTQTFSEMQQSIAELKQAGKKKEPNLSVYEMKRLKFNGDNPHHWLNKVEFYFRVNEIPHAKKLVVAQMCMQGNAAENWFDVLVGIYPQITWPEFKTQVVIRFRDKLDPIRVLEQVKQQGTVDEYLEEFEMYAAMVPQLTEYQYALSFQKGLKDEFQDQLKYYELTKRNIQELICLARHLGSFDQPLKTQEVKRLRRS
ncbi:hypothetical protein M5689_011424 [Euphorbia peplus]|nr:hypothetical protein M5689_011424 [Euphorbia peplus]